MEKIGKSIMSQALDKKIILNKKPRPTIIFTKRDPNRKNPPKTKGSRYV